MGSWTSSTFWIHVHRQPRKPQWFVCCNVLHFCCQHHHLLLISMVSFPRKLENVPSLRFPIVYTFGIVRVWNPIIVASHGTEQISWFFIPLNYRMLFFIASWCFLLKFDMNLLTTLSANTMLGLVPTMGIHTSSYWPKTKNVQNSLHLSLFKCILKKIALAHFCVGQ